MKKLLALSLFAVLGACATTAPIAIPPEHQSMWNQCASQIETSCHEHAQGDPNHENDCNRQARRDHVNSPDDTSRRNSLHHHGCNL